MDLLTLIFFPAAGLAVLFVVAWLYSRRIDNYSVVDVVWSFAFAPVAGWWALLAPGWAPRRWALALLVGAWSIRLGVHLYQRVRRHHPREDGRYAQMRSELGARLPSRMFFFFQAQAFSVLLLALPFLLIARHPTPGWQPWELVALGIWLLAWIGEAVADAQLAAFQRDPSHRGQVCDVGLWRYSRHPNYFFEWCLWIAYAAAALAAPLGWLGLLSPAIMLYLLLRVTGVPPTEAQSLRSRGDAYRRYQERTSTFFPWFRRNPSSP